MKFLYLDETGTDGKSANVIVAGLCVDAYRLNAVTKVVDNLYESIRNCYNDANTSKIITDVKTHKLINGDGGWARVDECYRNKFLMDVCKIAADKGTVFANAICCESYKTTKDKSPEAPLGDEWQAAAMFLVGIAQRLGQTHKSKGKTVVIIDEALSKVGPLRDIIHKQNPWFTGLYATDKTKRGWRQPRIYSGLDQIINTGFSTKSEHSSLIQMADTIAKIYSFHLELESGKPENWEGQKQLFQQCFEQLENKRKHFPTRKFDPDSACVQFYQSVRPSHWTL